MLWVTCILINTALLMCFGTKRNSRLEQRFGKIVLDLLIEFYSSVKGHITMKLRVWHLLLIDYYPLIFDVTL